MFFEVFAGEQVQALGSIKAERQMAREKGFCQLN
jgi:hypothetical protein